MRRQQVWYPEDVARVAREEGISMDANRFSVSGCLTHPDGFSRDDIVSMLRMLVATPEARQEVRDE